MKHGSLFSGIGGFDLAAQWMGWENVFHCEWNPFLQTCLNYYWPNAESFNDITKTNFSKYANKIDVLSGGFPCQPYSQAGKRKGTEDSRHLWPEMLRAIREIQPSFVVGENVFGLINWSKGMVLKQIKFEMEAEGYEVAIFILPACAVNAPHRRDRVWIVAYNATNADRNRCNRSNSQNEINTSETYIDAQRDLKSVGRYVNNPDSIGWDKVNNEKQNFNKRKTKREFSAPSQWRGFPTQSPICTGNDGFPAKLDGITIREWREQTIKAAGNAIVPQVALQIFKAITQCN